MASFKLFCILFLGVVATSMAASEEVSEEVSQEVSETEETERGFAHDSKGNDRCTCDNVSCRCCVTPKIPKIGQFPTCLRVEIQANQKQVNLQLNFKGRNIINAAFYIGARDAKCASLPGTLGTVKGCIDTDTNNLPGNAGIQTCAKLQFKTVGANIAQLIFPCVQLAGGRVSFNDRGEVKARDIVKIRFF